MSNNKPLQIGQEQGNFRIGSVAPVEKQEQVKMESSPMLSFLKKAVPAATQMIKNDMGTAEVQGALDAAATTDRMEEDNEAIKKYNWWLRDSYKKGYETAAATNLLTKHEDALAQLGKDMLKENKSDKEYSDAMNKLNEEHSRELWERLKTLPKDKGQPIAEKLRLLNVASLQGYRKAVAAKAYSDMDESMNQSSSASTRTIKDLLGKGEVQTALLSVETQLGFIDSNDLLSKKDKRRHMANYLSALTTDAKDPDLVNAISNVVFNKLGNDGKQLTDMLLNKQMEAAKRNSAELMIDIENGLANLENVKPDEMDAYVQELATKIRDGSEKHILGDEKTARYMSALYSVVDKGKKEDAITSDFSTGKYTISAMANMYGLSEAEKTKLINKAFPASMEGDVALMSHAHRTKDYEALQMALSRVAERTTSAVEGTMFMAEGDDQATVASLNQVKVAMSMYDKLDYINRKALLDKFPPYMRGVFVVAAAKAPYNLSATIFDTFRSSKEMLAQGLKQEKYASFKIENFDEDGSYFSEWLSFFGEADAQRNAGMAALAVRYNKLVEENPELTLTPDDTLKLAMELTKADVIAVDMGKFGSVHGYPSLGKSWSDSFKGASDAVRADTESQREAISQVVNETIKSLKINGAEVDTARFTMGGGADGDSIAVTAFKKGMGQPYVVYIDKAQLVNAATMIHKDKFNLSKDKMYDMAAIPVHLKNHTTGKTEQVTFQGSNPWGIYPVVINKLKANIARREGNEEKATVITRKDGTTYRRNGIGVTDTYHTISDNQTLDESLEQYNSLMDKEYIPRTIQWINKFEISQGDYALPLLVDLNYHGGGDSAIPMAKAMRDYQLSGVNFNENWRRTGESMKLLNALRDTPAYQGSGKGRREELENELMDWASRATTVKYNSIGARPSQWEGYPVKRKSLITN